MKIFYGVIALALFVAGSALTASGPTLALRAEWMDNHATTQVEEVDNGDDAEGIA